MHLRPRGWTRQSVSPALHTHHRHRRRAQNPPFGDHQDLVFADWSAQLRGDELADIAYRGVLLLRAIRVVIRDENWRTAPPQRTRLSVTAARSQSDHPQLVVRLGARHRDRDIDYHWSGTITFSADDLTFAMTGAASSTFLRNRIGIVVLHPLDDAGRFIGVSSPDGHHVEQHLPIRISPHQPLRNVRALDWFKSGLNARLQLSGDVFETEDQRNWTDASFKTYSTPLSLPFPVKATAGQRIQQNVRLTVTMSGADSEPRAAAVPAGPITVGAARGRLPAVDFSCSTHLAETLRLNPNPEQHTDTPCPTALLVELDLRSPSWRSRLTLALMESAHWRAPLDVRLVTDDAKDISQAVTELIDARILRIGVFHPTTHVTEQSLWYTLVYESYRLPGASLVGGSRAHFAELNRSMTRLPNDLPELTFSITPQMHATEREHIVDSLAGQRIVAQNAVHLAGTRPVHIGPISLKPRFNAVATTAGTPVVPQGREAFDDRTDDRQGTLFAAAWMLASVQALAIEGVQSLTYFETTGPRGLRPDGAGPPYPVQRLAHWLTELAGSDLLELPSDAPRGIHLIAAATSVGPVVVLSSLGQQNQTVEFALPTDGVMDAVRLDTRGGQESLSPTTAAAGGRRTASIRIRPNDVIRVTLHPRRPAS